MKHEEALRKAISCLKLAQSANQHEAALAAAKAQDIMTRYNLSLDDMEYSDKPKQEPIQDFGHTDPLHEVCQVDTRWTLSLSYCIARMNSCRTYFHTKASGSCMVKIIGRASDVQTVRYIFAWLEREVRRITKQECQGHTRKYQVDFRTGVVDTIIRKLKEQQATTFKAAQAETTNSMALMRVQKSIARIEAEGNEVELWMNTNHKLREAKFRKKSDWSARQHGQVAGEQVKFNQAKAGIQQGSAYGVEIA
jgi:ribosomal protein L29